jgi:LDH2 family malate/lactate/ureidoglycolate dehydrogenase
VGTNPICCFAPGAAGESFQLDMATTTVPIGKVLGLTRKPTSNIRAWP